MCESSLLYSLMLQCGLFNSSALVTEYSKHGGNLGRVFSSYGYHRRSAMLSVRTVSRLTFVKGKVLLAPSLLGVCHQCLVTRRIESKFFNMATRPNRVWLLPTPPTSSSPLCLLTQGPATPTFFHSLCSQILELDCLGFSPRLAT